MEWLHQLGNGEMLRLENGGYYQESKLGILIQIQVKIKVKLYINFIILLWIEIFLLIQVEQIDDSVYSIKFEV